jgi:hypothetical protein
MKKSQHQAFAAPAKPLPNVHPDQQELYRNRNIQAIQPNLGKRGPRGGLQARVSNNRQDQYAARGPES